MLCIFFRVLASDHWYDVTVLKVRCQHCADDPGWWPYVLIWSRESFVQPERLEKRRRWSRTQPHCCFQVQTFWYMILPVFLVDENFKPWYQCRLSENGHLGSNIFIVFTFATFSSSNTSLVTNKVPSSMFQWFGERSWIWHTALQCGQYKGYVVWGRHYLVNILRSRSR